MAIRPLDDNHTQNTYGSELQVAFTITFLLIFNHKVELWGSMRKLFKLFVNLCCFYSLALHPVVVSAQSITIDGSAPGNQRPSISSAGGKPLINIAPPTNGVSVNRYSSFSTNSGAVFNNSKVNGNSVTGGNIARNTRLGSGAEARVILNDVRGTQRSNLKGSFEVFGKKADVVITNQNGITCDGCSFINASRTTLGTGTASVNANGDVVLNVKKGNVHVGRGGATADGHLKLVGRTVTVDGPVKATVVDAIGGASTYNTRSRAVGANTGTGAAGSVYAVDATNFGAMTAGQIRIIGNEAGLGVRTHGNLTATTTDVSLHSKGDIKHRNVSAERDFVVRGAQGLVQQDGGTVTANRNIDIRARTYAQTANAAMNAAGNVRIKADDAVLIAGEIISNTATYDATNRVVNVGEILASGAVEVVAGEVWNMRPDRRIDLNFANGTGLPTDLGYTHVLATRSWADRAYMVGHGGVIAAQNLTITSNTYDINNSGVLLAAQNLLLDANRSVHQQALKAVYRTAATGVYLRTDINKAKSNAVRDKILAAAGSSVRDTYVGIRNPLISGTRVFYGAKAHGVGNLTVKAGDHIQNLGGEFKSSVYALLQTTRYDINLRSHGRWSHNFSNNGNLDVIAGRNINLTNGHLRSSNTLKIDAGDGLAADQNSVDAADYKNLFIRERGDAFINTFTINTPGWVNILSQGTLTGNRSITASAIHLQSTAGEVNQNYATRSSGNTTFISAGAMRVANSESASGILKLQSTGGSIYVQGNARGKSIDIDAEHSLINGTSTLFSGSGGTHVWAGTSITNEGGRIRSDGNINLLAGRKRAGHIISSHTTAAPMSGYIRAYGALKNVRLDTDRGTIRLTNNAAIASGNVTLNASGELWIQRSHVEGNTVNLEARTNYVVNELGSTVKANLNDVNVTGNKHLYNRTGANISARRDVNVNSNVLFNHGQSITADNNLNIALLNRLENYHVGSNRAVLGAGANLTITSNVGNVYNRRSDITAGGDINIDAGLDRVQFWDNAALTTGGALTMTAGESGSHYDGILLTGVPLTAKTITFNTTGRVVLNPGSDLTTTEGKLQIDAGRHYHQLDSDLTSAGQLYVNSNGASVTGSRSISAGYMKYDSGNWVEIFDGYARNPLLRSTSGSVDVISANSHVSLRNATVDARRFVLLKSRNNLAVQTNTSVKSRTETVNLRAGVGGSLYYRYGSTITASRDINIDSRNNVYIHGRTLAAGRDIISNSRAQVEIYNDGASRAELDAGRNITVNATQGRILTRASDWNAGTGNISINAGTHSVEFWDGATVSTTGAFSARSGNWSGRGVRLIGMPVQAASIYLGSGAGHILLDPGADLTATSGGITINGNGRFYQRNSDLTASGAISITSNGADIKGSRQRANGGGITLASLGSVDINDAYSRNPNLWAQGTITISSANSHIVNNGIINGGGAVSLTSRTNLVNDHDALIRSRGDSVTARTTHGSLYNRYNSALHAKTNVTARSDRGHIFNHGGIMHAIDRDLKLTAHAAIENHQWTTVRGRLEAGRNLSAQAGVSHLWSVASDWIAGGNMNVGSTDRQVEVTTGSTFTQGGSFTAFSSNYDSRGIRLFGTPITATSISLSSTTGHILLDPASLTATAGDITIDAAHRFYQRNSDLTASGAISITSNGADIKGSRQRANGGGITLSSLGSVDINDAYSRNPNLWAQGAITISSANSHIVNNGIINGGGAVSLTSRTNLVNDHDALIRSRGDSVAVESTHGNVYNRYNSSIRASESVAATAINIYNDGASIEAGGRLSLTAANHVRAFDWSGVRSTLTSGTNPAISTSGLFGSLRKALQLQAGTSSVHIRNSDFSAGTTLNLTSTNANIHLERSNLNANRSAYVSTKGEFRATGGTLDASGVTIDSDSHLYLLAGHRLKARDYDVNFSAVHDFSLNDSFLTAERDITLSDARHLYVYDSDTHAVTGSIDYTARGEIRHRIWDTDSSRTEAGTDIRMVSGTGIMQNYRSDIIAGQDVYLESTANHLYNNPGGVDAGRDIKLIAARNLYLQDAVSTRDNELTAGRDLLIRAGDTLYADHGFITAGRWLKFESRLAPRFYAQVYENTNALHYRFNVSQGAFVSDFQLNTLGAIDIYARDGVTLKKQTRGDNWVRVRSGGGKIDAGYLLRSDTKWLEVKGGGDITLANAQAVGNTTVESTAGSVINTYRITSGQDLSVKAHKDIIARHSVATRRGDFRGAASVYMNAGRNMTITNALVSSNGQIEMFSGQKEPGSMSVTTTLANLKAGIENRVTDGKAVRMIANGGNLTLVGAEIYGRGLVDTLAGTLNGGVYTSTAANINGAVVGTNLRGTVLKQSAGSINLSDTSLVGLSTVNQYAHDEAGITMERGRIQAHNVRIEALANNATKVDYRNLTDIVVGDRLVIDVRGEAYVHAGSIKANVYDLTNTPSVKLKGSLRNFSNNRLNVTAKNDLTLEGTSLRRSVTVTTLNGVLTNNGHLRAADDLRLSANSTEDGFKLLNNGFLEAGRNVYLQARESLDPGRIQAQNISVVSDDGRIAGTGAMIAEADISLIANRITTRSIFAETVNLQARTGSFAITGWKDTDGNSFATGQDAFVNRLSGLDGTASIVAGDAIEQQSYADFAADMRTADRTILYAGTDLTIDVPRDISVTQSAVISGPGYVTLAAGQNVLLEDSHIEAFGDLNVTSLEGMVASSTRLAGSEVSVTSGLSFAGSGVTIDSAGDASIFAAGGVLLDSKLHTYLNQAHFNNVVGTLAGESWANQRAGASGGGSRTIVSNELSRVHAGGDLDINALAGVILGGVQAEVGGDVGLTSGGTLAFQAPRSTIEYHVGSDREGTDIWDVRSYATSITAGGDFSALALDEATVEGAIITTGGDLALAALNDVTFVAAQNIYGYHRRTYDRNIFRTKTTSHSIERVIHSGTDLTANGTLSIEAQTGDLLTAGSRFESLTDDINLSATEGDIKAGVFADVDRESYTKSRSTLFGLISSTSNSLIERINTTGTAAIADLDLTIVSGGDTELVGAQLSAGRNLNINVGGDLRILAAINSEREEFFESKMGAILATTRTERSLRETAVLTSLGADGEINISVEGDTYLTLYSQDGETQTAAELYPDELTALANLILLDEELLNEYFFEETKALSPAFTAVLSIALTAGYSSLLTGPLSTTATSAGLAQTVNGVTTLTHAGRAVATFASSSTVGLANGAVSGDIDLGEILQSAALAAGTQFLTASINLRAAGDTAGADALAEAAEASSNAANVFGNQTINLLGGSWDPSLTTSLFGNNNLTVASALESAFDATLASGINSAVTGSDFRQGLTTQFVRSVVSMGLADAQNEIGDLFANGANGGEGSLGHVILHGIAGCTAAELSGADCASGAAGGIAGAVFSGLQEAPERADFGSDTAFQAAFSEWQSDTLTQGQYVSAAAAYIFSGGDADNVSFANSVSNSAIRNNYLTHAQFEALEDQMVACNGDDDCRRQVWDYFTEISAQQQHDLAMCGTNVTCMAPHLQAIAEARAHPLRAAIIARDAFGFGLLGGLEYQVEIAYLGHTESMFDSGLFEGMFTPDFSRYFLYPEWAAEHCGGLSGSACITQFQGALASDLYWQGFSSGVQAFAISTGVGALAVAPAAGLALRQCAANPLCFANLNLELTVALGEVSGATAGQLAFGIGTVGAVSGRLVLSHGDEILAVVDDLGRVFQPVAQTPDDLGRFLLTNSDGVTGYFDYGGRFIHRIEADELLNQSDLARFANIRSDLGLTSNNQLRRNVAIGEGHVDGADIGEIIGVSGARGPGVEMPENPIFATTTVGHPRDLDSEVFVLENLALSLTPESTGTIRLLSERTFCASCQGVIFQFREMFPNINLVVRSGVD